MCHFRWSPDAAKDDLNRRWDAVCTRISSWKASTSRRYQRKPPDTGYEADIREEIIVWKTDECIVTRNRYGAEILNCSSPVIADLDMRKPSWLWKLLFGERTIQKVCAQVQNLVLECAPKMGGRQRRAYLSYH